MGAAAFEMAFKGEDDLPKAVILDIADDLWVIKNESKSKEDKDAALARVMEVTKEKSMTYIYKHVAEVVGFAPDEKLIAQMMEKNESDLKAIEANITDAKENLGDTEVRDFLLEKSNYLSLIGNKDAALESFDETMKISVSLGPKIDLVFAKIRLGLFYNDVNLGKKQVEKAAGMLYEGLYNMLIRQFKPAAELFHSALATFTCTELF